MNYELQNTNCNEVSTKWKCIVSLGIVFFGSTLGFSQEKENSLWDGFSKILIKATTPLQYKNINGTFSHTAVDYQKIRKDKEIGNWFKAQTQKLQTSQPPNEKKAKLAFWINAYNFFTLRDMRNHKSVKSMKDIGWKKKHHKVGGNAYSLNQIEHKILRPLGDPRIHFAINCASVGCPSLDREIFKTQDIENKLTTLVRNAMKNPLHIRLTSQDKAVGTKLFSWFSPDFKVKPYKTPLGFSLYFAPQNFGNVRSLDPAVPYDWNLNTAVNIRKTFQSLARAHPKLKLKEIPNSKEPDGKGQKAKVK